MRPGTAATSAADFERCTSTLRMAVSLTDCSWLSHTLISKMA
jgi:hypothetical protein